MNDPNCKRCAGGGWFVTRNRDRCVEEKCHCLEPLPQIATGTESRVCADIAARQAKGIAKYGTTVEANPIPLREWLQHAYEETLDKAIYLKRAIEEMDK